MNRRTFLRAAYLAAHSRLKWSLWALSLEQPWLGAVAEGIRSGWTLEKAEFNAWRRVWALLLGYPRHYRAVLAPERWEGVAVLFENQTTVGGEHKPSPTYDEGADWSWQVLDDEARLRAGRDAVDRTGKSWWNSMARVRAEPTPDGAGRNFTRLSVEIGSYSRGIQDLRSLARMAEFVDAADHHSDHELALERRPGTNTCEHGDHEAPAGQRFCSPACEECEHASRGEDGCDGICESD